jgi:hypothetical protein
MRWIACTSPICPKLGGKSWNHHVAFFIITTATTTTICLQWLDAIYSVNR